MAWIKDKIRHIGTDAEGKELWRVKTSDDVVTEAVITKSGYVDRILTPVLKAEKDAEQCVTSE